MSTPTPDETHDKILAKALGKADEVKHKYTAEDIRENAIREHFPMPEDIRRHASAANYDLYFGPFTDDHWQEEEDDDTQPLYSFGGSLDIFAEWVRGLGTVWYDVDSGVLLTTEPTGEYFREDPDTGDMEYTFDPSDPSPNSTLDEEGIEWTYSEPSEYWVVDAKAVADAYGYATLLTYA